MHVCDYDHFIIITRPRHFRYCQVYKDCVDAAIYNNKRIDSKGNHKIYSFIRNVYATVQYVPKEALSILRKHCGSNPLKGVSDITRISQFHIIKR